MGWKYRACGSRDVFTVVIGEQQDGDCNVPQEISFKDSVYDVSLSPFENSGFKEFLGVSSPCVDKFQFFFFFR